MKPETYIRALNTAKKHRLQDNDRLQDRLYHNISIPVGISDQLGLKPHDLILITLEKEREQTLLKKAEVK